MPRTPLRRFLESASLSEVLIPIFRGIVPLLVALGAIGLITLVIFHSKRETRPVSEAILPTKEAFEKALAGPPEDVRAGMSKLAPLDGSIPGFPEAHRWLALNALGDPTTAGVPGATTPADLAFALSHLEKWQEAEPDNLEARELRVQVLLAQGRRAKALDSLREHLVRYPHFHLTLALLLTEPSEAAERQQEAALAAAHFQKRSKEAPGDHEASVRWAQAELLQGNYATVREIAFSGLSGGDAGAFRELLFASWLRPAQEALAQDPPAWEVALRYIEEAMAKLSPSKECLEFLTAMVQQEPKLEGRVRSLYESTKETIPEDADVITGYGFLAVALGDHPGSVGHFEHAVSLNPQHLMALNNLGYSLAFYQEPADLDRAHTLLDQAIGVGEASGVVPAYCWESRGQILAKLGQWEAAVADLERALQGQPGDPAIHKTLAEAYAALNKPQLAEQHQRLASREP